MRKITFYTRILNWSAKCEKNLKKNNVLEMTCIYKFYIFVVSAQKKVIRICDDATLLNEVGGILAQAGDKSLAQKALRRSITLLPEKDFEKYLTLAQFCTVRRAKVIYQLCYWESLGRWITQIHHERGWTTEDWGARRYSSAFGSVL